MDESQLERLINQCKNTDIDVRVDGITKLQAEFEAGVDIPDPDALIATLKACLRTQNQHLTNATLSALPPVLPLLIARQTSGLGASTSTSPGASTSSVTSSIIDAHTLRTVLNALLPSGGIIERLGDNRDRARDKARESLVILGGFAYRSSGSMAASKARDGKGPETPLMIFERFLKDAGFGSKQGRVREQAIVTLVQIRRVHHLFPIRSFLPLLVATLEDSDASVRECAKQSVVELFTGPSVTDAARADLKKEMNKKGVRKGTVDIVLSRVAAGGSTTPLAMSEAGSENGEGSGTYVPPSTQKKAGLGSSGSMSRVASQNLARDPSRPASRAAVISPTPVEGSSALSTGGPDVKVVYIASSRDLENEFAAMLKHFEGKESEHNWLQREQAITRVRGMLKGDVHERFTEAFLGALKEGFIDASLKALLSLRTTVSSNTCYLYSELAIALGSAIDPVAEPLYVNLLRMANLTKKIIAQQSQATLTTVMQNCAPQPRLVIPLLWNTLQDKAIQTRVYVMGHIKTYLDAHAMHSRNSIESSGGVDILEKCLKKGLTDPNPGVRDTSRQTFWVFESVWRERGRAIMDTLDGPGRKQLEKACPDPKLLASIPSVTQTPQVKKSSVAAAIAASRAKAKAIATAPPSLRHQATSAARVVSSPPGTVKRAASPSLSTSSSGGARPTSPLSRLTNSTSSPPRARVVSAGALSRSTGSTGFVPNREQSRQSQPGTPPSPTPEHSNFRRRISSPLASPTGNSVLRRAMQTALPASPPPSDSLLLQPATTLRLPPQRGVRESINIAGFHSTNEDSLLLASNIPIPEDSDSDMDVDTSVNMISFSTPFERYPPAAATTPQAKSAGSFSPRSSSSRPPVSNALSTGTSSPPAGFPQPMVEDAMRARAEQAESAAERLLELVDPDEEGSQSSTIPASLLLRSTGPEATPKGKVRDAPRSPAAAKRSSLPVMPRTPPASKKAAIMRKAALFQDSPAPKPKPATSLFDMISGSGSESAWANKRRFLLSERASLEAEEPSDRKQELNGYIASLEHGTADIRVLKKLAFLCQESPVNEPISPISPDLAGPLSPSPQFGTTRSLLSLKSDLWDQDKSFERLFRALMQYLEPTRDVNELEYALIVLWELLEHQAPLLEGRESETFSALLRVRYCAETSVMQATHQLRDALTSRIEPVYGLTVMHASLRAFRDAPLPASSTQDVKNGTYSFGLIALGKFILRLPAEVLEDELPRLRGTLISALTDQSSESSLNVREAAAASIIAAQLVLRDERRLFSLLNGLPEDKMNLLTYFFDKHGCRGSVGAEAQSGMEKLEREMRRLDGRTSTSMRPSASPRP